MLLDIIKIKVINFGIKLHTNQNHEKLVFITHYKERKVSIISKYNSKFKVLRIKIIVVFKCSYSILAYNRKVFMRLYLKHPNDSTY